MLFQIKNGRFNLSSLLIEISHEVKAEKIFIWDRSVNPVDYRRLKKHLSHAKQKYIIKYLYNNEISYAKVYDKKIEIYRDFFGLSDIYYFRESDEVFISETLKDFYNFGVNLGAIEQYQRIGYIPADSTIINNVKKAFPGEKIIFDIDTNKIENIRKPITDIVDQSVKYSSDTFQEHFEAALTKNLEGAEGLLLSGGFDSALLAYFLNKKGNSLVAFTGYTKDIRNQIEKERSIKTAELFCKRHELVEFTDNLFEDIYFDVFRCMDEPFADNAIIGESVIATRYASYACLYGLKRLAEGEAADAFWGHAAEIKKYLLIKKFIRNDLQRKIASKIILSRKLRNFGLSEYELIKNYSGCKCLAKKEFDGISYDLINSNYIENYNSINMLIFLSSNIGFEVPKIKIVALSAGINIMAPFLESNMMKLSFIVPPNKKFNRDKGALKDLYEKKLHRNNYEDQKMGFLVPTARWILNKHRDILFLGKFYKNTEIYELLNAFESKPSISLDQKIWRIFVLNQWYEINKNKF